MSVYGLAGDPSDSASTRSFAAPQKRLAVAKSYPESEASLPDPPIIHQLPPLNSGIRYYNFQGFNNRVEGEEWDYTFEVLLAKHDWEEEVVHEEARRWGLLQAKRVAAGLAAPPPPKTLPPSLITQNGPPNPSLQGAVMASSAEELGENRRLLQVRIRSLAVLKYLSELAHWDQDTLSEGMEQQIVFCRPFATFRHCHNAMKEKLATMEKAGCGYVNSGNSAQSTASDDEESNRNLEAYPYRARIKTTPLEDLRLYVELVETHILPLWARYKTVTQATPKRVFYDDIPFLFEPGELVYVQQFTSPFLARKPPALQKIFRTIRCNPRDEPHEALIEGKFQQNSRTSVKLYFLDYDGEAFKASHYEQLFGYFEGEREITSLPCYPLQFHLSHCRELLIVGELG